MIPILFEKTESTFTTNGIGHMTDAVSCIVTEERNGIFELTMEYPMTGIRYLELQEDRILLAQPRPGASNQAFRIYKISRPIGGVVTVYARHISYALGKTVVMPYTAGSAAAAFSALKNNVATETPFNFWTDKNVTGRFRLEVPSTVRSILGGQAGSLLDVYGPGEYEWDMYTVKFHQNRGQNRGVTIRYGKNLTDLTNETTIENAYTAIVPYFADENTVVTLPEKVLYSDHVYDYADTLIQPVDLTGQFEMGVVPTVEQLRNAGQAYLNRSSNWKLGQNIDISFVNLADTEEYKDVSALQRVNLCDTVKVVHPQLGIEASAQVISVEYDVLLERYNSMELGDARTNLSQAIIEASGIYDEVPSKTEVQQALEHATQLITGGLGGYVVMKANADGTPEEILIMDTPDINTAVNVIRMNKNGIAFSRNGYDPEMFATAWTIDGSFVADYITSGVLNANIIKAGIISDQAGKNSWNLVTGDFTLSAEAVVDTSEFVTQAQFTAAADRIATEVVEQVGSGIFFNVVPTDNGTSVTLRAHVYLNRNDATNTFPEVFFRWYKKTESQREYIGYGYEITVIKSEYGYGGEVEATFLMLEDRYPVNSQGKWVFTEFGSYHQLTTSQGQLKYSQGYPVVWSDSQESGNVYPIFGYDFETQGA